jgi:hypothetical protein
MAKQITIKYYRDNKSLEVAEIDYNLLKYKSYNKDGKLTRLLGSNEDRIEAYLMRKGWLKINLTTFNKIKETFDGTQV